MGLFSKRAYADTERPPVGGLANKTEVEKVYPWEVKALRDNVNYLENKLIALEAYLGVTVIYEEGYQAVKIKTKSKKSFAGADAPIRAYAGRT